MLPPNLLIVSMVVLLATTISTAPVEETEQEEVEVEVEAIEEGEGELSEEEEDDDGESAERGALGVHQTTAAAAAAAGGPVAGDPSSSADSAGSADSSSSAGSAGSAGSPGSAGSAGSAGVGLPGVSADVDRPAAPPHTDGSDGVDSESNGNGQKLLNGGGGGGADSHTGVMESFVGGASHLDYTGLIDQSSHDFLLSLMGGVDPFSSDGHINIQGHMTPPTHMDSIGISSGVTVAPSTNQYSLASLADPAHHSDISIDQLLSSSVSASPHSVGAAASSSLSHSEAHREHTDGADSPDTNGNGRQTLLTDASAAVTERLRDVGGLQTQNLQTDLTGGGGSVTGLHADLTASGLGLGRDVTESSVIILHTESVGDIKHTLNPVSDIYSHTDLVTMTTDSTGTDTVAADPTGTPLDSSHPAVTDHTQMAGSVTEQYNTSGQGPEGAENVELEDTC